MVIARSPSRAPFLAPLKEVSVGPRTFELLWLVKDGVGYAALSAEPSPALIDLVTAKDAATLRSDAATQSAVDRIGAGTSFALFVQPLQLGLGSSMKSSAPVVMALGKDGSNGWLRLDADRAAVRAIVQRFVRL
jgi:hypothetical protein